MNVQVQNHPSVKVIISGISGSGKSTLFEKLISRERAKWIFLYDHKDGDLARRFKVKPCFDRDQLDAATARGGFVIFNPAKEFPLLVHNRKLAETDSCRCRQCGFDFFCRYLWAVKSVLRGKKIFGADELDGLVDTTREPEPLCLILDQGRTFQIDCFFIAQATNGIHNQVRKQFREIFVMMQGDKNGLAWLAEKGFDPAEINSLTNGQWLYKNLNTREFARGGKAFTPKNASRDLRGL